MADDGRDARQHRCVRDVPAHGDVARRVDHLDRHDAAERQESPVRQPGEGVENRSEGLALALDGAAEADEHTRLSRCFAVPHRTGEVRVSICRLKDRPDVSGVRRLRIHREVEAREDEGEDRPRRERGSPGSPRRRQGPDRRPRESPGVDDVRSPRDVRLVQGMDEDRHGHPESLANREACAAHRIDNHRADRVGPMLGHEVVHDAPTIDVRLHKRPVGLVIHAGRNRGDGCVRNERGPGRLDGGLERGRCRDPDAVTVGMQPRREREGRRDVATSVPRDDQDVERLHRTCVGYVRRLIWSTSMTPPLVGDRCRPSSPPSGRDSMAGVTRSL